MKRFFICLVALALLLGAFTVIASANEYEDDSSILASVQLHPLYVQSGMDIYSDLAEDYLEWWWEEEEFIDDTYYSPATINMRGFAMSPTGDYAYMGTLNGGDGLRGVVVLNTVTGVCTDLYYHYDQYPEGAGVPAQGPFSYAKGIDADDRGYVYVGFAFSSNYNVVNLGIAKQESDGTLTEVSFTPVWENGTHGDTAGTHVGVNGVDVVTIGEKTYCYVVVNYDYDAIYCFDVTDPTKPVLNTEFGTDGFINFSSPDCPIAIEGKPLNELQYLDVEEDGTIWVVMYPNGATNGVLCISPDGTECISFFEVADGDIYSITSVGEFLLCGSKSTSYVYIVSKDSGELIDTITPTSMYGNRITRMVIRNDILYVCDAGSDDSSFNAIYAGALSESGLLYLQNVVKSLNGEFETEAPEVPEETGDVADTGAEDLPAETKPSEESLPTNNETGEDVTPPAEESKDSGNDTGAAEGESKADESDADESKSDESKTEESKTEESKATGTAAVTDKPAEKDSGCASLLISGSSLLLLAAAAFVTVKRK